MDDYTIYECQMTSNKWHKKIKLYPYIYKDKNIIRDKTNITNYIITIYMINIYKAYSKIPQIYMNTYIKYLYKNRTDASK